MEKSLYPIIHYFEQDFVDMYDKTWIAIESVWKESHADGDQRADYMDYSNRPVITALEAVSSSFFLVYSNLNFEPMSMINIFYNNQDKDGYIPYQIVKTDEEGFIPEPDSKTVPPPLFAWAEFNHFNKTDNKKRLKEISPMLDKFHQWIEKNCYDEAAGLFTAPVEINGYDSEVRKNVVFPIDFNCQMALSYYFMSQIATNINQRSLIFKYTKAFYALKSKINEFFWNPYEKFYFDLDKDKRHIPCKTLASYWSLLTGIPSEEQFTAMYSLLRNPDYFGTETPFASVSKSEKNFDDTKANASGAISPFLSGMIIKGLEIYKRHEFARESSMRLLYSIFTRYNNGKKSGLNFYDYYPVSDNESKIEYDPDLNNSKKKGKDRVKDSVAEREKLFGKNTLQKNFSNRSIFFAGYACITLLIENVIGFDICLPKKILHWVIPCLEDMGIEKMRFKKNSISTIIELTKRGWEIRHASEKLYYFSIDVPELSKLNTLPIPSGKCSLLLEKM